MSNRPPGDATPFPRRDFDDTWPDSRLRYVAQQSSEFEYDDDVARLAAELLTLRDANRQAAGLLAAAQETARQLAELNVEREMAMKALGDIDELCDDDTTLMLALGHLAESLDGLELMNEQLLTRAETAEAACAALREQAQAALLELGRHKPSCRRNRRFLPDGEVSPATDDVCTCGLEAALASITREP